MNYENKLAILNKIKEYDRIMLFRHVRLDGDCVGSTKGFQRILQLSFPDKEIYLVDGQHSEFLAFLGPDGNEIPDELYKDALGIVLDTASLKRVSNPKWELCKELVKIDHHIPITPYGDLQWVEEERSSACEMIVDFYDTFRDELKIDNKAATYLYTGMVTDSGRFRYSSVSGQTMRLAGLLLDLGLDLDTIYANLYLDDFDHLKFKSHVYKTMKITENGVAHVFITKAVQEKFGLNMESASSCVSFMDSIKGCLCWIAFIETGDDEGTIRVRLRSRFTPINHIAENYRGGGHDCASGATVYNRKEMRSLIKEADAWIKEYKETHEGWL